MKEELTLVQELALDSIRTVVDKLPDHRCAYCGSLHTVMQMIEREPRALLFSIFCNSCNLIDRPTLFTKEMMKILRAMG